MHDVEKWLENAPRVLAPENFLENLMARICREDIQPLPIRPSLPVEKIGYALLATAAAMLILSPFVTDIADNLARISSEVSAFISDITRPHVPFPKFWPTMP